MCKVSVVMSVYNCEQYVGETIQSIIDQTFTDWEFIIINDCSRDRSAEVIRKFDDPRIIFIDNKENKGQSANLNYGISIAKGEYIARTDHDDISYPTRFEKQVKYLDDHPDVVLLGTAMQNMSDKVVKDEAMAPADTPDEVAFVETYVDIFPHSSFMIRKKAMLEHDIWYENYSYAEDYSLQLKMLTVGKIFYLHEYLIAYRIFPGQWTQLYSDELKRREVEEIRLTYLEQIKFRHIDVYRKAFRGELCSKKDFQVFQTAFEELASFHHLDIGNEEFCRENRCVKYLFKYMMGAQICNGNNLEVYKNSSYKDEEWLASSGGIKYVIDCQEAVWSEDGSVELAYAQYRYRKAKENEEKYFELFSLMSRWVLAKQEGRSPAAYLEKCGYRRIAIYGMSQVGQALLKELESSSVEAAYAIDQNADWLFTDCKVVKSSDPLEEVDAIVVTSVFYYDSIRNDLCKKMNCPILSIRDVIDEL